MSISRFVGATSREAMRQVRMALGPDALIVSNRRINGGVEILATDSTDTAAAHQAITAQAQAQAARTADSAAAPTAGAAARPPMTPPPHQPSSTQEVMSAIQSLKGSLEGRIEEVMWSNQLRVNTELLGLFQQLLSYGFSMSLLRAMLKRLPAGLSLRAAMQWVRKELDTHLPVLRNEDHLWQPGLALALVGPTGVGKTTTIAKLAARAVRKFSSDNVVLITTDTYRIGAHEQLKIYADLMHIPIHVVQKPQQLRQVILGLRADQVILIDNVGVSQRDKYVQDQSAMLASAGRRIQRLLVVNAASHGDTLDEVARMYRKEAGSSLTGCVISKVDEASRLGAALDIALRYQLPIHYVSDGQRVPEDLRYLSASQLVDMALAKTPSDRALFAPSTADLAALISANEVQEQAKSQSSGARAQMLQQVLALSSLSNEAVDIEQLRYAAGLVDEAAFASAAFDFWRDSKKKHQLPDLPVRALAQLRDSVLEANTLAAEQPVFLHHIKQRLSAEKAQLYALAVGAGNGELLALPLLQRTDQTAWYTNSGIKQRINPNSADFKGRFELLHAMQWVKEHTPPSAMVHWVEEHNTALWQQWQQENTSVMALAAPSMRCWHIDGHSTPAAIAKQLNFHALNQKKMPLSALQYWYAQTAIELRPRGAEVVRLQLFILQCTDVKQPDEVKNHYAIQRIDAGVIVSPEEVAISLLQHIDAKRLLRDVARAEAHAALNSFMQQHSLDEEMGLELAALLGGAAWELEQVAVLDAVKALLLALSGDKALRQTQITASLLKLFNLKELLQQH